MRLLLIGDIVGKPGRDICVQAIRGLRAEERLDLVVANAENAAGGSGLTPEIYHELIAAGIDGITLGDHVYRRREIFSDPPDRAPHRPAGQLSPRGARATTWRPPHATAGPRGGLHAAGPGVHAAGRLPLPGRRPRAGRAAAATSA